MLILQCSFFMIVRLFYGRGRGSLKGQYNFEDYYFITVITEKIFVRLVNMKIKSNLFNCFKETVNSSGNDYLMPE
jgi:hypothetical protein